MSTQMETTSRDESPTDTASDDTFIDREAINSGLSMDAEEFEKLSKPEQRHILWEQSRNIPFRYAKTGRNKMRRYLAGGVIPRCKIPTVLFETFPKITEFRQSQGRAYCSYNGLKSKIFVDFGVSVASSAYRVREANISHELMHSTLCANDVRILSLAYRRDGRTDRAWYYNGGFPNWDFGGGDVSAETYLHRTDGRSARVVSQDVLDDMLSKRLEEYEENGLYDGVEETHSRDGREDPFSDDIKVTRPEGDREAFLLLVGEADIAWYTTAKAFSEGYEEVARKSIFWDNYSATSPAEFLCRFHQFFQSPGLYSGTHAKVEQAVERHPWLLKRYLDCFEPHPDKQSALDI